jgi:uncharacterized metal-binding protein YceD (DUF177 family)
MSELDPILKIYVDQLRGGKEWSLNAELTPEFIGVQEAELIFTAPVFLKGKAYLAEDDLVIQVSIATKARMPCRVCNDFFDREVLVEKLVHVEPLTHLKRGFVDISPILREAVLLEIPPVAECHGGHCPRRQEIEKYLSEPSDDPSEEHEGYQPFKNLSLNDEE